MLLFLSNEASFQVYLVFIGILGNFRHNLFTCFTFCLSFNILWIVKLIQCLNAFFTKASKILMRLNVLCSFQPQNGLIMFLFSMKHSYLLTVKSTSEVSNFPQNIFNLLLFFINFSLVVLIKFVVIKNCIIFLAVDGINKIY